MLCLHLKQCLDATVVGGGAVQGSQQSVGVASLTKGKGLSG